MDTANAYLDFARVQARGASPLYEEIASGVATDRWVLALLDQLPPEKRQPNLLLGAVRYLTRTPATYAEFRDWLLDHAVQVTATLLERRTQTNEVGRCATLLPLLAGLPQPLALLEVGASAGLCLLLDRYCYDYDGQRVGPADSPVELRCAVSGPAPIPTTLPEVVWRAGIDLNPLDVSNPDDVRWLEALVWPGQPERVDRLRAAVQLARDAGLRLVRGDLNDELGTLAAEAPAEATLVVFHSAVLPYLAPEDRQRFVEQVLALPGHWVANEAPHLLAEAANRLPRPAGDQRTFLLALDGVRPVAFTAPHGQWLDWF